VTTLLHQITPLLHAIDHAAGRLSGPRRVLVEIRTPVSIAVLSPIYRRLALDRRLDCCWITPGDRPDVTRELQAAGLHDRVLPRRAAEWMRVDLYMNADPWDPVPLRRCARRLNFFHGVAGKYDLDRPAHLPLGFEHYDRVAFVNRDRMRRYLDARIVTPRQAALVGYPKIDALARGRYDGAAVRESLGLERGRPTILYGPTSSTASSLYVAGEQIVETLIDGGFNVIVKLHDRSVDASPQYTGGVDWRRQLGRLERPGRLAVSAAADSSPYLAASDLLITDHSSIGFEYCVLDRPLIIFEVPELAKVARINPEKITLLRSAADVVNDVSQLCQTARDALAHPGRLSSERRHVASEIFFKPGTATDRALALGYGLLALTPPGQSISGRLYADQAQSCLEGASLR
jgi:hypothetical protein